MEDSEAKCDKCEVEVRPPTEKTNPVCGCPEPKGESVSDKILFRPEQLIVLAQLSDENRELVKQNNDLMGTLFGIGFIALCTVIKYTVFY